MHWMQCMHCHLCHSLGGEGDGRGDASSSASSTLVSPVKHGQKGSYLHNTHNADQLSALDAYAHRGGDACTV